MSQKNFSVTILYLFKKNKNIQFPFSGLMRHRNKPKSDKSTTRKPIVLQNLIKLQGNVNFVRRKIESQNKNLGK